MTVILALRKLRQGDQKFRTSLGYMVRSCLKSRGRGRRGRRRGRQERKGERGEKAREPSVLYTLSPEMPVRICFGRVKYYRAKNYQKVFQTWKTWA